MATPVRFFGAGRELGAALVAFGGEISAGLAGLGVGRVALELIVFSGTGDGADAGLRGGVGFAGAAGLATGLPAVDLLMSGLALPGLGGGAALTGDFFAAAFFAEGFSVNFPAGFPPGLTAAGFMAAVFTGLALAANLPAFGAV